MRKIIKERKQMKDELSQRFFQLSRQRKNNNEQYKMWGDIAYLEKAKMIDEAMSTICEQFKHYDDIEYREKLQYNSFYRQKKKQQQNKKVTLSNGYVNVNIKECDVDDYISYYPEFYRVEQS